MEEGVLILYNFGSYITLFSPRSHSKRFPVTSLRFTEYIHLIWKNDCGSSMLQPDTWNGSLTCSCYSIQGENFDSDSQLNLKKHEKNYMFFEGFNPLTAKLFNLNFHPLEVVTRWRDPQLQVSENCSDLTKWRSTLFKSCWLMAHLIFNIFKMWYLMC